MATSPLRDCSQDDYKVSCTGFVYLPAGARYDAGMNTQDFILAYIESCASGRLNMSECGPIWQLAVIAVFLLVAVIVLAALRLRARPVAENA